MAILAARPVPGGFKELVLLDANSDPIPLKDHNPDKYSLYMSDPAKHWRFSGKK